MSIVVFNVVLALVLALVLKDQSNRLGQQVVFNQAAAFNLGLWSKATLNRQRRRRLAKYLIACESSDSHGNSATTVHKGETMNKTYGPKAKNQKLVFRLLARVLYSVVGVFIRHHWVHRCINWVEDRPKYKASPTHHFQTGMENPSILHKMAGDYGVDVPTVILRMESDKGIHQPNIDGDKVEYTSDRPIFHKDSLAMIRHRFALLKGKNFIPVSVLRLMEKTFPKVIDMTGYASGLSAACSAIYSNVPLTIRSIMTTKRAIDPVSGMWIEKFSGVDGSGRIHPNHQIFAGLGWVGVLQIRLWAPEAGLFAKGILVPDSRCVDSKGNPDIWLDWGQIKGSMKSNAKKHVGTDKVLGVSFGHDASSVADGHWNIRGKGYIGILNTWKKPGSMKMNFEFVEKLAATEGNLGAARTLLKKARRDFNLKNGIQGILESECSKDDNLALVKGIAEKAGIDPLQVPMIRSKVGAAYQRWVDLMYSSLGFRGQSLVVVIDNGVPEGHVFAPAFRAGADLAVGRVPCTTPQAVFVVRNIDLKESKFSHLSHLSEKKGLGGAVFMNSADIVDKQQGDDDGDFIFITDDRHVVKLFRSKIDMGIYFGKNPVFAVEPGKDAGGVRSTRNVFEDGTITQEGAEALAYSTQGPVGFLTDCLSAFLSLDMKMHSLVCAVSIQEAIDAEKHNVHPCNPSMLLNPTNWVKAEGSWKPNVAICKADEKWLDGDVIGVPAFSAWFSQEIKAHYPEAVGYLGLSDRPIQPGMINVWKGGTDSSFPLSGMFHEAYQMAKGSIEKLGLPEISETQATGFTRAILKALGAEGTKPLDFKSQEYRDLMTELGVSEMQNNIKKAMNTIIDTGARSLAIEVAIRRFRSIQLAYIQVYGLKVWENKISMVFATAMDMGKTNLAMRLIGWEGSPVIRHFGVTIEGKCSLLASEHSRYWKRACELVGNNEFSTEIDVLVSLYEGMDTIHEMSSGVSLDKCSECKKGLEVYFVDQLRARRVDPLREDAVKEFGKDIVSRSNAVTRNPKNYFSCSLSKDRTKVSFSQEE